MTFGPPTCSDCIGPIDTVSHGRKTSRSKMPVPAKMEGRAGARVGDPVEQVAQTRYPPFLESCPFWPCYVLKFVRMQSTELALTRTQLPQFL